MGFNLFGAQIGALMNVIFPNLILAVLLLLFYLGICYILTKKGILAYNNENKKFEEDEIKKALIVAEALNYQKLEYRDEADKNEFVKEVLRATYMIENPQKPKVPNFSVNHDESEKSRTTMLLVKDIISK